MTRVNVTGVASEEPAILHPEGGPYEFSVSSAKFKISKMDNEMIELALKSNNPEFATCDTVWHYMLFPVQIDDMEPEEQKAKKEFMNRMRRLDYKNLLDSAGIDYDDTGFDLEELQGRIILAKIKHSDGDRGVRAEVSDFVPPEQEAA